MDVSSLGVTLLRYRYWVAIPLAIVEGPMVAFAVGTLSALGYFNPLVAYGLFVAKDVALDSTYFYLGRRAGTGQIGARVLQRLRVGESDVERLQRLWNLRGWQTMFVGKMAWGLSPLFLVIAGVVMIPVGTFIRYVVGVAALQYGLLFAAGYYFGGSMGTVSTVLRIVQFALAGALLVVLLYVRFRLRSEGRG
jgi:membrane protein DedA with SNARE-associated domain